MKGLIRHDFAMLFGGRKIWIIAVFTLMMVVEVLVGEMGILAVMPFWTLFGGVLGMSAFHSDAYTGWNAYVAATPVKRSRVVLARYLYMLLLMVMMLAIIVSATMLGLVVHGKLPEGAVPILLLLVDINLLFISVQAPLQYLLGQTWGRIAGLVLTMAVYGIALGFCIEEEIAGVLVNFRFGILPLATVFAVAALALSYWISTRIYSRKDL